MATNLSRKLKKTVSKHYAIVLPEEVAGPYEEMAEKAGVDVGELLSDRLAVAAFYTAEKPLYFDDEQRKQLEKLLDYNFSTSQQVIDRLRVLFSVVKIVEEGSEAVILLSPNQIYRLAERAKMAAKTIAERARDYALEAINREVGIY